MVHCANYRAAVGPFGEQGCERSELPCLASDRESQAEDLGVFLPQSGRWTVGMVHCACNRLYSEHYRLSSACYRLGGSAQCTKAMLL